MSGLEVKFWHAPLLEIEVKDSGEGMEGEFTGYASVFDVVDEDGDMVVKGAFKRTLAEWRKRKRLPPITWQHDLREPLGPFHEVYEDDKGLRVRGQLLVHDIERARSARALLKANAIDGMSIGFLTREAHKDPKRQDVRRMLTQLDLFEIGLVTAASNRAATVNDIKLSGVEVARIESLRTPKEFEDILREAGFSRNAATAFVAKCRNQGEPERSETLARLHKAISQAVVQLKGDKS